MLDSVIAGHDVLAELRQRYLIAQLAGNRRDAVRVVLHDGLGLGISVPDLPRHVIQEAQREIGRLSQENEINIAQEHVATAISHLVLAQLVKAVRATWPELPIMIRGAACLDLQGLATELGVVASGRDATEPVTLTQQLSERQTTA